MTEQRRMPSAEDLALCAHDLRGALTVIVGYAALLRHADLGNDARREAIEGIELAVHRADKLIAHTMAGGSHETESFETVDLDGIARRAVADASVSFDREVIVDSRPGLMIHAEASAITRLIENLLGNAAKYAPSGPIDLRILAHGDRVTVEVSDRGPGIPERDRSMVLEPFARLERDQETYGNGLGLTVVNSVASRHGGQVSISEREGGGATVTVTLPTSGT